MLRKVVGVGRKRGIDCDGETIIEDWVSWVQRATKVVEKVRKSRGLPEWVEEIARRKFRWAGHVARRQDGRWNRVLLDWAAPGYRGQVRPVTRWRDSINKFFHGTARISIEDRSSISQAQNCEQWKLLEEDYVTTCVKRPPNSGRGGM